MDMYNGYITDVEGVMCGHCQSLDAGTGCSVILFKEGAVGGVDVRGSAPGTRETDLLRPMNMVQKLHGILLTGGSAFGLAAADGVMKYLEERGIGYDTGVARVPIVSSAVLYDLAYKDSNVRPDVIMGYNACKNAELSLCKQGIIGAGAGATVGKLRGTRFCSKSGLGSASIKLQSGLVVSAMFAVNAFGDIVNPKTGDVLAGVKNIHNNEFISTVEQLLNGAKNEVLAGTNTTIGVVATNANLNKEMANKLASISHDGLAKTISPVHTMMDGDTIFAAATGKVKADMTVVCTAAVEVVSRAVINAVLAVKKG